nr:uncharacterized protein LOC106828702 [Equus asinus]
MPVGAFPALLSNPAPAPPPASPEPPSPLRPPPLSCPPQPARPRTPASLPASSTPPSARAAGTSLPSGPLRGGPRQRPQGERLARRPHTHPPPPPPRLASARNPARVGPGGAETQTYSCEVRLFLWRLRNGGRSGAAKSPHRPKIRAARALLGVRSCPARHRCSGCPPAGPQRAPASETCPRIGWRSRIKCNSLSDWFDSGTTWRQPPWCVTAYRIDETDALGVRRVVETQLDGHQKRRGPFIHCRCQCPQGWLRPGSPVQSALLLRMGQKLEVTGKTFQSKSHTLPRKKQFLSTAQLSSKNETSDSNFKSLQGRLHGQNTLQMLTLLPVMLRRKCAFKNPGTGHREVQLTDPCSHAATVIRCTARNTQLQLDRYIGKTATEDEEVKKIFPGQEEENKTFEISFPNAAVHIQHDQRLFKSNQVFLSLPRM